MIRVQNIAILEGLAALFAVGGELDGAEVQLYKSLSSSSPQTDPANFEMCDFTGSAPVATAGWITGINADGRRYIKADEVNWTVTAVTNLPQQALGYVILNAGGDVVSFAPFDQPVDILQNGQILYVIPVVAFEDAGMAADGGTL